MTEITSPHNHIVKEVRSLKTSKGRQEKGLFFIEGTRIFEEALKSEEKIKYAVVSDSFVKSPSFDKTIGDYVKTLKIYVVPDRLFRDMADTDTPQGIMAVLPVKKRGINEITDKTGLYVFLDEIRDPGNMGTIIRTADAAGFSGVIVTKGCADVYNPKVIRSTMGSVFHLPVYFCTGEPSEAFSHLKNLGIRILASSLEGGASIFETDMTGGTAIVIGNEAFGISLSSRAAADGLVFIPMEGNAESLNASVAAGIMMFEAVRQRKAQKIRRNNTNKATE